MGLVQGQTHLEEVAELVEEIVQLPHALGQGLVRALLALHHLLEPVRHHVERAGHDADLVGALHLGAGAQLRAQLLGRAHHGVHAPDDDEIAQHDRGDQHEDEHRARPREVADEEPVALGEGQPAGIPTLMNTRSAAGGPASAVNA